MNLKFYCKYELHKKVLFYTENFLAESVQILKRCRTHLIMTRPIDCHGINAPFHLNPF